jgi:hypothetical protein
MCDIGLQCIHRWFEQQNLGFHSEDQGQGCSMIFKQFKTIFKSFVKKKIKAFLESTMSGSSHQNHSWNCVSIRIKTIKERRKVCWFFVLFCFVTLRSPKQ